MVEIMIRLFNHAFYECHGISHVLTHRRQNELQVYELVHVQPYIGIILAIYIYFKKTSRPTIKQQ